MYVCVYINIYVCVYIYMCVCFRFVKTFPHLATTISENKNKSTPSERYTHSDV